MTYNTTITGIGFVPLLQTTNRIVDGYLGLGFLVLYVVVAFVVMKNYPSKKAALGASFLGMIISVFFNFMGILSDVSTYASFCLFLLSMIWLFVQD